MLIMLYCFPVFPGTEVLGIYLFYSELHTINTPKVSEFLHNIPKTQGYLFWPQQSSMKIQRSPSLYSQTGERINNISKGENP